MRTLTVMSLLLIVALAGCEKEGTQCCALKRFCDTCTTCESSEASIGSSGDETACQQVNDMFIDVGQYCHLGNATPRHSITEFIADCAN